MIIAQKNRKMKFIIQRLQTQLRQKINTFYRLRQLRNQYRSTIKELIKELINQITRLQFKKEKEMYNFDNKEKQFIEKKIESLLRYTKKNIK